MAEILSIQNISKSYGPVQALKQVSFQVPEGSVFGILGPNGSGKTTMLATLLDILKPDSGSYAWFGGMNQEAARRQIGTLLETPNFYHYLSAEKNLQINAALKQKGATDIDRVLALVKLTSRKQSAFSTYSLGMKQRLAIANALLGHPRVLLLDEPTNGLDPEGIAEIRELIRSLRQEGITIIMASHLLDEVEKVCTDVAILKKGDLLLSGNVKAVFQNEDILEAGAEDLKKLKSLLEQSELINEITQNGHVLQLVLRPDVTADSVNRYCFDRGIVLQHLNLRRKSLESRFMELTRS